ncbi:type II secretion system F family protein [Magnetospirillum sp. UT-4]|uniref:type II secretion system F family protein n=1 Tax=Magnetospirillum sp. UT-4 TaxID=2681467 RepID=UPI0013808ECF|nr:type II secretion system F family protein [Magnetospirillum sp. UT-4]CAA7625891.1 Type II secretion system F domain protein [Magnetospirillum sp. UT-4]
MSDLPVLIFAVVLTLLSALGLFAWWLADAVKGPRATLRRRIARIGGVRPEALDPSRGPSVKRRTLQARIDAEGKGATWAFRLREQMMQAGIRAGLWHYLAVNAALAALGALFAWAGHLPPLAIPLAALIVGLGLPKFALSVLAARRIGRFTGQFAEALDVIVRGLRSGLPLGECIAIIGRDMPAPLGTEFRLMAEGQKLGLSLQEALERAVERTPTADFKYFAIVLAIQQQTGGNLAETLAKLAEVLRARKRMRDKIKAYSSEATASAAIIGSLPLVVAGMLFLVGRDYVMLLFTTDTGQFLVAIGVVLMLAGALVMRRMINFDM